MFDPLTILVVILFGSSTFFRKLAVDEMSPYHLQALAGIIYFALVPFWLRMSAGTTFPSIGSLAAGSLAVITNVIGAVIFGFLLKRSSDTAVLSSLASASPVVTAILAIIFLGETMTISKLSGISLVLLGMFIFNR